MLVVGLGIGCIMQIAVLAVQNAVAYRDLGTATSATVFFRLLGGSLGTALFGAILVNGLQHNLAVLLPGGATGQASLDVGSLQGAPSGCGPCRVRSCTPCWRRSPAPTRSSTAGAIPFAVVTLLLALLLPETPLRTTAHVGRDQEEAVP